MIFTIGNIITLGVVLLILILYRLTDKNNRSLERVKKYAEKCKEEIAAYADEKSMAVKNFGIDLDVEKKAAHQLMKNIQKLTEEELSKKSQAIARIDEHINAFESSLEELFGMTDRVQENLNRIRDESAFVESTGKNVREAKEKFEHLEKSLAAVRKNLEETEVRLERKNAEILEQTAGEVLSSAKSMLSDFETTAHVIERKIEEHREAVLKAERERETLLAHDLESIRKTLKDALENAGKRADKMEETALVKLREQAGERVSQVKTFFEEKIKSVQETLKTEQINTNEKLKTLHDKLNSEILDISAKQKNFHQEWVKNSAELNSMAKKQKEEITSSLAKQQEEINAALAQERDAINTALEQQQNDWKQDFLEFSRMTEKQSKELGDSIASQNNEINSALEKQMETWKTLCRDTEQGIIAQTEKRINEYSLLHSEAVKQLNSVADDASRLESELRLSMQEAVSRVKNEFSVFEKEAGASMESAASSFNAKAEAFRKELEEIHSELNGMKQQAFDNVSDKLTIFEKDWTAELGKRASEIGRQIAEWQAGLLQRLDNSTGKINEEWQQAEERITAEQRKNIASLSERLKDDLERLKQEAAAFEMGIREEMHNADETRSAFAEQIKQDLAEIRVTAENEVRIQVGKHQISMNEIMRQKQREIEKEIEEISEHSKSSYASLEEDAAAARKIFDEWQNLYNIRMREMDSSLENIRRYNREIAAENDERIAQLKQGLEDVRKELSVQKKIFDKTGELKLDLERRMEEINADLDRLDQRKNEITQLENQFTHIKRLEDEVNRKMTSFLSEKRRLEVMEKDFERFVKTSQAVETKLAQVSSSDDILQAVQIQIRKLEDSLKETEEKYQRVERKNEVLEETNEGIDRNFKTLQKTETAIKNAEAVISSLFDQFDNIRTSIETLAAENVKAAEAAEKISVLDDSLVHIEQRIDEMNKARSWIANSETRLEELNKDIQKHYNLTKSLIERKGRKPPANDDKGSVTPQDRDNVIRLRRQGFKVEEIADILQISRGAVDLILEFASRD